MIDNILHAKLVFPGYITVDARDLIERLLILHAKLVFPGYITVDARDLIERLLKRHLTLDDYDDESESDLEDINVRRPKPKHDPPVVSS